MNLKQTVPSFEEIVAPMVELNKIALGYTEKLVELNFSLLRKQSELVMTGWREVLSLKDAEQVKEYLAHQGEAARNAVNDYIAEAKTVTELNQAAAEDMRKVVEASIAKAAKKAA